MSWGWVALQGVGPLKFPMNRCTGKPPPDRWFSLKKKGKPEVLHHNWRNNCEKARVKRREKWPRFRAVRGEPNCGVGGIDKLAMKDFLYIYVYIYIYVLFTYHYIYRKRDLIHNHVSLLVEKYPSHHLHKIIQDARPGIMSHHPKGGVFKLRDQCYLWAPVVVFGSEI